MIGFLVTFLVAVSLTTGSLHGVDPNTLSCDPAGQQFLLLPHFTDCDRFYMCTHGREVDMPCAPGTIFDFPIQVCNHPWATECWLRQQPTEEPTTENVPETTIEPEEDLEGSGEGSGYDNLEPESILNRNFDKGIINCYDVISAATQTPFNGDCQRYWKCVDRIPKVFHCNKGLYFNPRLQQCDFEANVKCIPEESELQGEFMLY